MTCSVKNQALMEMIGLMAPNFAFMESAGVRGKFKSLTMVNWNGFFARTFDLDQLVTTLSGGNGAGKSTTMAAFIAALIPDQSLLHFRNTTEAGSSSASRDKGLYGKLQRGHCYSLLEVMNSREQRIWVGVHLGAGCQP